MTMIQASKPYGVANPQTDTSGLGAGHVAAIAQIGKAWMIP